MSVRMLSDPDLRKKGIQFSRQHRHRLIAEGKFPAPVKLGGGYHRMGGERNRRLA
jgi:predicted DNA-binding transcriptional regulator AlpA